MVKKVISLLILIAFILIFISCDKQPNNEVLDSVLDVVNNENKPLEIEKIIIPNSFKYIVNEEEFVDIKFVKTYAKAIQIVFNQEIVDENYTLGFFSSGYFAIKNKFNENNCILYEYSIDKNTLTINPKKDYYHQLGLYEAIYIPNTIISKDNNKLSEEKLILLSRHEKNEGTFIENNNHNYENERKNYSLSLVKQKNDGINLAFVNNEDNYIFSSNDTKSPSFKVYKGENAVILDETNEMYYIKMYFKNLDEVQISESFEITKEDNFNVVNGYIKKNNLTKVLEPFYDSTKYLVKTFYQNDMGLEEYYINLYVGGTPIRLGDNVEKLEEKDLYSIECTSSIAYTATYNSYFSEDYLMSSKVDSDPNNSRLDVKLHMPEYNWSENDYECYMKAYNYYCNYMIDKIKNIDMIKEMEGYKKDLLFIIDTRIALQHLWIDWGYKNKLENSNYMFEEIYNKLSLTEEQMEEIQTIFSDSENKVKELLDLTDISEDKIDDSVKELLFNYKLIDFYNGFDSGLGKFYQYFNEMLDKKYYMGENFNTTNYEQMKKDSVYYYEEKLKQYELERLENEKRVQDIIDSGSDISEVDEVFRNYLNLDDEEKGKITKLFSEESEDYDGDAIYCTVEEKQCVKGTTEVLFKVNIYGIRNEQSKLEKDKIYNVIFINTYDYGAKSYIEVGHKLKLGVRYKKGNYDVLYTDYFMIIGEKDS